MKAFLVIAALLLAIPTYGLSVVLLVFYIWVSGRSVDYEASKRAAYGSLGEVIDEGEFAEHQDGTSRAIDKILYSKDFWYPVEMICQRSQIPSVLINTLIIKRDNVDFLFRPMFRTALLRGMSEKEMQLLASDFVKDVWKRLNSDQKAVVFQAQNGGDKFVNLHNLDLL